MQRRSTLYSHCRETPSGVYLVHLRKEKKGKEKRRRSLPETRCSGGSGLIPTAWSSSEIFRDLESQKADPGRREKKLTGNKGRYFTFAKGDRSLKVARKKTSRRGGRISQDRLPDRGGTQSGTLPKKRSRTLTRRIRQGGKGWEKGHLFGDLNLTGRDLGKKGTVLKKTLLF